MELRSFDDITVCGAKGSGKSTLENLLLKQYPRVVVYDPLNEFKQYPHYVPKTNAREEFAAFCRDINRRGNIMILASEAELYLPVVPTELLPDVMETVSRGRHRNVGLMLDTRRIANLNKTAFSLCEYQFIFRHWSPNDLDYLKGFLPVSAVGLLPAMPDYHFLINHQGRVTQHLPMPYKKDGA